MKQTIEIEVPEGKKAIWKDNKMVFENIEPQLPKSWREFCEQNKIKDGEFFLDNDCYIEETWADKRHESYDRNILPNKQAAEQHLALMQLHQLRDCYRQGWIPDWNNNIEKRYCIVNKNHTCIISNTAIVSCFLSFQSQKLAEEFLDNFKDLIKQAGDLI